MSVLALEDTALSEAILPYVGRSEPAFSLRAPGYDYDHEILVGLPPSYDLEPDRSYPVVWVMAGALILDMVMGIVNLYATGMRIPEVIVVGVGHPREEGMAGLGKRTFDLFPPGSILSDEGAAADYMKSLGGDPDQIFSAVKGDQFLDFLLDGARSEIAQRYRIRDDHTLMGHSAGGAFGGYALFAKPGGFQRFMISSGTNGLTLDLEAEYAASNDDLPAKVFIDAGDLEANNVGMSAQRIVSRTMILAENLQLRQYPSLQLTTRVYTARDHFTVMPVAYADALQNLFAEEAAALEPMPW